MDPDEARVVGMVRALAEVREACSELGTLLLDLQPDKGVGCSDPADRSDLKIKIFFPSPVSWRAGDQNRRLALDRHELLRGHDHNGRMGGEPSVALALGLQCHALEPSALARGLEDAADVWVVCPVETAVDDLGTVDLALGPEAT